MGVRIHGGPLQLVTLSSRESAESRAEQATGPKSSAYTRNLEEVVNSQVQVWERICPRL